MSQATNQMGRCRKLVEIMLEHLWIYVGNLGKLAIEPAKTGIYMDLQLMYDSKHFSKWSV